MNGKIPFFKIIYLFQWNLEFLTSLTKHAVQYAWDKLDILECIQIQKYRAESHLTQLAGEKKMGLDLTSFNLSEIKAWSGLQGVPLLTQKKKSNFAWQFRGYTFNSHSWYKKSLFEIFAYQKS